MQNELNIARLENFRYFKDKISGKKTQQQLRKTGKEYLGQIR